MTAKKNKQSREEKKMNGEKYDELSWHRFRFSLFVCVRVMSLRRGIRVTNRIKDQPEKTTLCEYMNMRWKCSLRAYIQWIDDDIFQRLLA